MAARRSYWRWSPDAASLTIVGLPFVAAIVRTFRGGSRLAGDLALTELAVRAVGTHAVLVGPYSRFGWNHPGPIYFYALAPWYWLFGGNGRAVTAGAILIGLAAAVVILAFARRAGGRWLMLWAALVVSLLVWHLDDGAWSSWTPYATILPAAAFVITAWSLACADRWALPVMFVAGTFIVQTHVGYVPLAFGVGTAALVVCALRVSLRREGLCAWWLPGALAAGLLLVMWIPPSIDALTHDPSNLDRLVAFREDPGGFETHTAGQGWSAATGALGGLLDGPAEVSADGSSTLGSWASLVTLVAVAATGALAILRRRWNALVLLVLLGVAFTTSVYAVSEVVGPLFAYLVAWTSVLSLMAWVAVGAVVVPELENARLSRPIAVSLTVVGGLAAITLAWPGSAPIGPVGSGLEDMRPLGAMISRVERRVPDGRPVVVRVTDWRLWPTATAVVAGLRDDGFDAHGKRGTLGGVFARRDLRGVRAGDALVTVTREPDRCRATEVCVRSLR